MRDPRNLLAAGAVLAVVLLATSCHAQVHVCGPNAYPVSVLNDPTIYCVTTRPCSGQYALLSREGSVGACPPNTGCALLPQTPSVMGCVKAGLPGVSYVNPDGSLSTGGGPVVKGTNNDAVQAGRDPVANANTNTNNNVNTNPDINVNSNATIVSVATSVPATTTAAVPETEAPSEKTKAPEPTTASVPVGTVATAPVDDSTHVSVASNTQSMDDINGGNQQSKARGGPGASGGVGSVVAIGVGCLAVVAIIGGVFVLRKNKESTDLETPMDYGIPHTTGLTPKEQVQML